MNSMAFSPPATRARRARLSAEAWDGFDARNRNRRASTPVATTHSKAAPPHAHLTFAETPDLYLREEMA